MEPADETRAYLEFLIPQSLGSQLPGFLRELETRSRELGISDVQLSLTSLEEVFLTIARKVCKYGDARFRLRQRHCQEGVQHVSAAILSANI